MSRYDGGYIKPRNGNPDALYYKGKKKNILNFINNLIEDPPDDGLREPQETDKYGALYIMIGIPYSGKRKWAKCLNRAFGAIIVDEFLLEDEYDKFIETGSSDDVYVSTILSNDSFKKDFNRCIDDDQKKALKKAYISEIVNKSIRDKLLKGQSVVLVGDYITFEERKDIISNQPFRKKLVAFFLQTSVVDAINLCVQSGEKVSRDIVGSAARVVRKVAFYENFNYIITPYRKGQKRISVID